MLAKYYDKALITFLCHQKQAKVHSIFQNGMNIQVGNFPQLIFIYADKHRLLPNSICLTMAEFLKLKQVIHMESHICIKQASIKIDDVLIHLNTKAYDSCLNGIGTLQANRYAIFKEAISQLNVVNGFGLRVDDRRNYVNDWQSLVGKGVGLTPSGDDMIVGMYAASYFYPKAVQSIYVGEGTTTDISRSYLYLAKKQQFDSTLKRIIFYLENRSEESIIQIIEELMAYGHTSGVDMLSGFYALLRYYSDLK